MVRGKRAGPPRTRKQGHARSVRPRLDEPCDSKSLDKALEECRCMITSLRAKWADVGIELLRCPGPALAAAVKQRYSDFIVNEIDLNGNVVHLTSFDVPKHEVPTAEADEGPPDAWEDLRKYVDVDALRVFVSQEPPADRKNVPEMTLGVFDDKEQRTAVHALIKRIPEGGVFSHTVTSEDGHREIRVSLGRPSASSAFKNRDADWPGGDCKYLQMTLHKANIDTMKAIHALSQVTGISEKRIEYAGNKDRRAITTQLITMFKADAQTIARCLPRLRDDVRVGNFCYVQDSTRLGSLKGNRFGIVLRDVQLEDGAEMTAVDASLNVVREAGFVNYFGLQRFGTGSASTHMIGMAIMQERFDLAVSLILVPQDSQQENLRSALQYFGESFDYKGTLERLQPRDLIERTILRSLEQSPNAFVNALCSLPRNMRLLYVHAFQSAIWNRLATFRLKELDSTRPVVGDLVLDRSDPRERSVIVLDADSVERYTIEDVVLPLPGYDIKLPGNAVGQHCMDLLAEHNLSLEKWKHRVKDFSACGAYRHVVVKPTDMNWDVVRYDDKTAPLLLTDMDRMRGAGVPESVPDGAHVAIRLEFSLPSSSYATVFLREVMKREPLEWTSEDASEPSLLEESPRNEAQ
ncbi:unnamed protein product (mitochondrion) [Plasmodiophora brassicae]|uniref:TRUD domain-containing protein n=1 Tax=Plasmodiophora brassicae TaxID=37360 RepID=A0A0G4J8I2_PLABS|nr:hypothetical protein PBRA_003497 [Plasmodiophora brassicae]SPQ99849.1 unnamed protein product [Plasmodiophora brassicae]